MRPLPLVALVVHVVSLAIWLGGVVASGLAAAIIFPTMKSLDPRLPGYSAYAGDHWMLAAGKVAARIFHAIDIAQLVCAALAVLTAGLLLGSRTVRPRPLAPMAWLLGLAGSLGVLGAALLWLRPRMDLNLAAYWQHAGAGQTDLAEAARQAFSADHPMASNLMAATALFVLLTLAAAIPAALSRPTAASRKPAGPPTANPGAAGR